MATHSSSTPRLMTWMIGIVLIAAAVVIIFMVV